MPPPPPPIRVVVAVGVITAVATRRCRRCGGCGRHRCHQRGHRRSWRGGGDGGWWCTQLGAAVLATATIALTESFDYSAKCHVPKKEGAKTLRFQLSITRPSLQLVFEPRWEYYSFKST